MRGAMLGAALGLACTSSLPAPPDFDAEASSGAHETSGGDDDTRGDDGSGPVFDPRWSRWEVRADDYAVPTQSTTYVCFGLTVTVTEPMQVVAFAPAIDRSAFVHHMILYRIAEPYDRIEPCYPGPPDAIMQWGWGPGGRELVLPPEAGFPLGGQPGQVHFMLQVHYENPSHVEGIVDRSGIDVYGTTELRPDNAAIVALGDVATLVIPPGQPAWPSSFWCTSQATAALLSEPVHVFGSWLHAHELGRVLWTEQYRDGQRIGELGRQDPYDFADQRFLPLDATIEPGDELRTHCTFDSTARTEPTHGGGGTEDEMCLNYLLYHPAQPLFFYCNG